MIKLPQRETRTLVAIHGWSGIVLGLLLYVVICTGVAAVFAAEINDWASPLPTRDAQVILPRGIDALVTRLAGEVDPKEHEEIAIFPSGGGRLNLRFHHHELDAKGELAGRGVEYEVDPTGWKPLARRAGWEEEIDAQSHANGVADFLINLHVRLHIPNPYGLFVTGVLGLAMMIAAITGLVIHRHLIADLFTLRLGRDALLRRRDLHVVAGTWNLPFAVLLAFTGSFFSFATSVGLPAVAMVQFGGDQLALSDTLYGTARKEDATPAKMADLEPMLDDARRRNGAEPYYVSISHYGRADATVSLYTHLPDNTLVYANNLYDGVTGQLLRMAPPLGLTPSTGAALVGVMYPLHFGDFAGSASKAVWVGLGSAAAYVTLSGMLLWTRRRAEQPAWRRMARVVHHVGYGLPLALAGAPLAFFALRADDLNVLVVQDLMLLAVLTLAAVPAYVMHDLERVRRLLVAATGIALLALPLARLLSGGPGWSDAWSNGNAAVAAVDLALLASGAACLWLVRAPRTPAADGAARGLQPKVHAT